MLSPVPAAPQVSASTTHSPRRPIIGADDRTRTGDLVLTKDALYLLSYIGPQIAPTGEPKPAAGQEDKNPAALLCLSRQDQPVSQTAETPSAAGWAVSNPPLHLLADKIAPRPNTWTIFEAGENWSGRRGSNPRPTAWKAVTLPLSYSRLRVLRRLLHCSAPLRRRSPTAFLPRDALATVTASYKHPMLTVLIALKSRMEIWWRGEDSNLRSR